MSSSNFLKILFIFNMMYGIYLVFYYYEQYKIEQQGYIEICKTHDTYMIKGTTHACSLVGKE